MAGYLTKQHASIIITDGAGNSLTVRDVGDFQIGPIQESGKPAVAVMLRGSFDAWVHGDEAEQAFSFSCPIKADEIVNAGSRTIYDAITKTGAWSAATTTNPGGVGPMTYTLVYGTSLGGTSATQTLFYCQLSAEITDSGDYTTLSVSGRGWRLAKAS